MVEVQGAGDPVASCLKRQKVMQPASVSPFRVLVLTAPGHHMTSGESMGGGAWSSACGTPSAFAVGPAQCGWREMGPEGKSVRSLK